METTWDKPTGSYGLTPAARERRHGLALERRIKAVQKERVREARRKLLALRREEQAHALEVAARRAGGAHAARAGGVWADSLREAVPLGALKVRWQRLGDVHADVLRFDQCFGRPLLSLELVGHDLKALPEVPSYSPTPV